MGLDISLVEMRPVKICEHSITHNLVPLASELGVYRPLWRPDEASIERAEQLVPLLRTAVHRLREDKGQLDHLLPENGFGTKQGLLHVLTILLESCEAHPGAEVRARR